MPGQVPLEKGVLSNGRFVCSWHSACYRLQAGEHPEPPGRDPLLPEVLRLKGCATRNSKVVWSCS